MFLERIDRDAPPPEELSLSASGWASGPAVGWGHGGFASKPKMENSSS